jgi:hypothetical protein
MQNPAFYDRRTGTVAAHLSDGTVVRVPLGDFLQTQVRVAHQLRQAAIDTAVDTARRHLRRLRRRAGVRLGRFAQGTAVLPKRQTA